MVVLQKILSILLDKKHNTWRENIIIVSTPKTVDIAIKKEMSVMNPTIK